MTARKKSGAIELPKPEPAKGLTEFATTSEEELELYRLWCVNRFARGVTS